MNTKEMEALIIKQGEQLQAQVEAHMHLVQRTDNIVEGFKKELEGRDEVIGALAASTDDIRQAIDKLRGWIGADQEDGPFYPEFKALTARIEVMEKFVLARNISAAMKRNMVDEDALRVLTGDVKDLSHKDAAEKIGLTYAQVYSCRLEFTFKHVHKHLRDEVEGWKNPWAK
jgi:hypothetical protein